VLRPNAVKAKLGAGDEVYGLFCAIPSPVLVEMIGCAGYDFVILDTEHSLVDPQQLENLIRAAEGVDVTPFVRVPEADPATVLRCLDAGAMGAADFSQSYGVPWETRHPTVRDGLRRIHAACAQAGVPFCAIPRTRDDHAQWRAAGVRAFVPGEERGLAARTLRAHLADHRSPDNL
jgi:2-keto-3-deoxy-L-rhamnonate aldolase RhmA